MNSDRIAARQEMEEFLHISIQEATEEQAKGMLAACENILKKYKPQQATSEEMSEEEAAEFEAKPAKFQRYFGIPYGDIPIMYLDAVNRLSLGLRRYMRSDRAKRRIGAGEALENQTEWSED